MKRIVRKITSLLLCTAVIGAGAAVSAGMTGIEANAEKYELPLVNENGIVDAVEVTKLKFSETSVVLGKGRTTVLKPLFTPSDATDQTVTWFTSDKSIVTVKDGTVTGIAIGSCTITAKSSNGKKATCTVKVTTALNNTSVINSDIVQVGDKVRIAPSGSGGSGEYSSAVYYKRSTSTVWKTLGGEFTVTAKTGLPTAAFQPTAEGSFDIRVVIKDTNGLKEEKKFSVKVVKELELTNVSVVGRESIKLGTAIPMIGKAVGGKGPYTYSFYFKRSTNTNWKLLGDKFTETASARFRPTATGTYDIRIDVKDSAGTIVKKFYTAAVK